MGLGRLGVYIPRWLSCAAAAGDDDIDAGVGEDNLMKAIMMAIMTVVVMMMMTYTLGLRGPA